jgi:hypothetical protein
MENMDNFRERFEVLERRTQMVEQRLRWWRGMACGVFVLALLSLALLSGKAADAPARAWPNAWLPWKRSSPRWTLMRRRTKWLSPGRTCAS